MPVTDFELSFGVPGSWWIPVWLRLGESEFEFNASSVSNDPMQELVASAIGVLIGDEATYVVGWWREPEWHSLVIEPTAGDVVLLRFHWNHDGELATSESIYELTVPAVDLGKTVLRSLEDLRAIIDVHDYESREGWSSKFPGPQLDELKRMVGN